MWYVSVKRKVCHIPVSLRKRATAEKPACAVFYTPVTGMPHAVEWSSVCSVLRYVEVACRLLFGFMQLHAFWNRGKKMWKVMNGQEWEMLLWAENLIVVACCVLLVKQNVKRAICCQNCRIIRRLPEFLLFWRIPLTFCFSPWTSVTVLVVSVTVCYDDQHADKTKS